MSCLSFFKKLLIACCTARRVFQRLSVTDVTLKHQKCGKTPWQSVWQNSCQSQLVVEKNFCCSLISISIKKLCCVVIKLLTSQHPHCGSLQAVLLGCVFPRLNPGFSSCFILLKGDGLVMPVSDWLTFCVQSWYFPCFKWGKIKQQMSVSSSVFRRSSFNFMAAN